MKYLAVPFARIALRVANREHRLPAEGARGHDGFVHGQTAMAPRARGPHDSGPVLTPEIRNRLKVRSQPSQQPHELNITPALAFQLAARTHLVEVSIDVELKKIAWVITRSTRSRRDRTHETQADYVKAFGEGINHPDCCFSPDVVVDPYRQEACLLTVLASNVAHGKGRIVIDAASLSDSPQCSHSLISAEALGLEGV